ncbi:MAG: U32 family peptidase, partial [Acholeplasmataceae bacterium]|nr:U32 family peptidase [Acholeplasmataceae bacterium]
MKNIEILAPAGSMASLIGAVNSGADAVYLAGKRFGARAYADNFQDDELSDVIRYAHVRDVLV